MNKLIIAIVALASLFDSPINQALAINSDIAMSGNYKVECKYSLAYVMSGLKTFVIIEFVPREISDDGNSAYGAMFYHNPLSTDKKSVDAVAIVTVDNLKAIQKVFAVAYYDPKKSLTTTYLRQVKESDDGSKSFTECFERTIDKVK